MQQPMFRDVLWAIIESSDRDVDDVESEAYREVLDNHPDLTRPQFDEVAEVLVRTDHLRRWKRPTEGVLGSGVLMPTAKGRLQFAAAIGTE